MWRSEWGEHRPRRNNPVLCFAPCCGGGGHSVWWCTFHLRTQTQDTEWPERWCLSPPRRGRKTRKRGIDGDRIFASFSLYTISWIFYRNVRTSSPSSVRLVGRCPADEHILSLCRMRYPGLSGRARVIQLVGGHIVGAWRPPKRRYVADDDDDGAHRVWFLLLLLVGSVLCRPFYDDVVIKWMAIAKCLGRKLSDHGRKGYVQVLLVPGVTRLGWNVLLLFFRWMFSPGRNSSIIIHFGSVIRCR